jgi:hypothetical protein
VAVFLDAPYPQGAKLYEGGVDGTTGGFSFQLDTRNLAPGTHKFYVYFLSSILKEWSNWWGDKSVVHVHNFTITAPPASPLPDPRLSDRYGQAIIWAYRSVLKRDPDPDGFNTWYQYLSGNYSGADDTVLRRVMYFITCGSSEGQSKGCKLADYNYKNDDVSKDAKAQAIIAAYRNVLKREPTAGEFIQWYSQLLNQRLTQADIEKAIVPPPPPPPPPPDLRIVIDDVAYDGTTLTARGWAADVSAGSTGTGVKQIAVYLDDTSSAGWITDNAPYGQSRPDVAKAFGNARFEPSGWSLSVTRNLAPGPHTLYVYAFDTYTNRWSRDMGIVAQKGFSVAVPAGTPAPVDHNALFYWPSLTEAYVLREGKLYYSPAANILVAWGFPDGVKPSNVPYTPAPVIISLVQQYGQAQMLLYPLNAPVTVKPIYDMQGKVADATRINFIIDVYKQILGRGLSYGELFNAYDYVAKRGYVYTTLDVCRSPEGQQRNCRIENVINFLINTGYWQQDNIFLNDIGTKVLVAAYRNFLKREPDVPGLLINHFAFIGHPVPLPLSSDDRTRLVSAVAGIAASDEAKQKGTFTLDWSVADRFVSSLL